MGLVGMDQAIWVGGDGSGYLVGWDGSGYSG